MWHCFLTDGERAASPRDARLQTTFPPVTSLRRWRGATSLATMMIALVGCAEDPAAPSLGGPTLTTSADDVASAAAATRGLGLKCAPSALRVPRGSTVTVACDLTMPSKNASSLTVTGNQFPRGVRMHLVGADSTPTLAAGTSTTVFLAADVDSVVATGQYTGTLTVKGKGASQKVSVPLEVSTSPARVRMAYLIPSDRTYDPQVAWGIERAARHLQIWYQQQLGTAGTFTLHWPVVDVVYSARPASDFAPDAFNGVGQEVRTALGDQDTGSANVYAVYFDVVPTSPTGGAVGLATLPHNDVEGIAGRDPIEPIRRWVGGLGHELGHAFGLPHPDGCDAGVYTSDCWSLMYFGYITYPSTFLAEVQKPSLTASQNVTQNVTTSPVLFDVDAMGPTLLPATGGAVTGVAAAVTAKAATTWLQREQRLSATPTSRR